MRSPSVRRPPAPSGAHLPPAPWLLRTTFCAQVKWSRAAHAHLEVPRRAVGAEPPCDPSVGRLPGVRAGLAGGRGTSFPLHGPAPITHVCPGRACRFPPPQRFCSGLRPPGWDKSLQPLWQRVDYSLLVGSRFLSLTGHPISPLLSSFLILNGFVVNIGPGAIS